MTTTTTAAAAMRITRHHAPGRARRAPAARRTRWLSTLRGRDPGDAGAGAPHDRHRAAGAQAVMGGRHLARLCALAWVLGAAPSALSAQSSDSLFATGVRAYKN